MGCSIMSELKVDTIVNLAGTGKPNLPVSPTLEGAAISAANTYSYTSSATEPSSCLLYTSPSPRDVEESRMPSSA